MIATADKPGSSSVIIQLNAQDNVAICSRGLAPGEAIDNLNVKSVVPRGHKIALTGIAEGQAVRKYAQIIGYASN